MDIRLIVFGMVAVLVALFLGAKFFVPREKEENQREAAYAESVLTFRKFPNKENFFNCLEMAKHLKRFKNYSEEQLKEALRADQVSLG